MVARPRRRPSANLLLALTAVGIVAAVFVTGDRTDWSRGFGYDGRTYGDLAQHFPGAIFGDDGVARPGVAATRGDPPEGIDTYYVRRIFPSAVVYSTLEILQVEKTHRAVVWTFSVYNILILGLIAFLWGRSADLVGIGRRGKLLGLLALLVNFAALKTSSYYPVATDTFAYGLGALTLYFWLRNNVWALALTTFACAFTWPSHLLIGAALIAFPWKSKPLRGASFRSGDGRAARVTFTVLGIAALAAVFAVYKLWGRRVFVSPPYQPVGKESLFALSALVSVLFAFAVLAWLLPDLSRPRRLLSHLGTLVGPRGAVVLVLVLSVLVSQELLADRPGLSGRFLLGQSLTFSIVFPGIFLAALFGYYGPMLVLAALRLRAVRALTHEWGVGMTVAMAAFAGGVLLTEPRKVIDIYPIVMPVFVLAVEQARWSPHLLWVFALASVAASRVWLPIGDIPWEGFAALREFPAQRFYMSTGIWMNWEMYLVHLAAIAAAFGLFLLLRSRRPDVRGELRGVPAGG